jgi:hypothetical protein
MISDIGAEGWARVKRLETQARNLGFEVRNSRHDPMRLALWIPRRDPEDTEYPLPVFSGDLEFTSGTVNELLSFLWGWTKRIEYETYIGVHKTIERRETLQRQRDLVKILKQTSSEEESKQ